MNDVKNRRLNVVRLGDEKGGGLLGLGLME